MKFFGDIKALSGYELPVVDCITGGSPCQDLSVAGKRAGLDGERSGLFMEQIRIVKEMRERDRRTGRSGWMVRPRYMVWENVPGAFSSNGGKDFQAVLTEIVRIADPEAPDVPMPDKGGWSKSGCLYSDMGDWSIAWRVHDAQFWGTALYVNGGVLIPGTPQRRKRIALVADFGGRTAPEICFERKGLSRDPEPRGAAGKEAAGGTGGGAASTGRSLNGWDVQSKHIQPEHGVAETLYSGECRYGGGESYVMQSAGVGVDDYNQEITGDVAASLTAASGGANTSGPKALSFQERAGKPGGGKGILIQDEHVGALSTLNNQSVFCLQGGGVTSQNSQGRGWCEDVSYTLNTLDCPAVAFTQNQRDEVRDLGDVAGALAAEPGIKQQTYVATYGISSYDSNAMKSGNPHSGIYETDTARTLDCNGGSTACNQGGIAIVETYQDVTGALTPGAHPGSYNGQDAYNDMLVVGCYQNTGHGWWNESNIGATIRTPCGSGALEANIIAAVDCRNGVENPDTNGTLQAKSTGGISINYQNVCRVQNVVRRLTPLECERLQGYPDGWTDIGEWIDSKGKRHKDADSPRYKALGNSIALPFWFWLLRRISAQYERPATLGSLFDGIGGFPLCWERCNGHGTALWSSEIEEFPICVVKRHFGGDA